MAFVLVAVLANAFALFSGVSGGFTFGGLPLLALPLALVGMLDDLHNLPVGLRYGVQLVTGFLVILLSPLPLPWLALPFLLIAVTAVINFTNFMDGLDGLLAGCMAVVMSALAISIPGSWYIWALVGALVGFLVWNWCPAKIFMGDVGSTFLGCVFAGFVLQASSWYQALGLLLVSTPLLGDACICVPRRLLAGQRVFQPHRLHLFQRLHQAGWPHSHVSTLYIAATAALAVVWLVGGLAWVVSLAGAEILVGLWLDRRFAVSFAVASRASG